MSLLMLIAAFAGAASLKRTSASSVPSNLAPPPLPTVAQLLTPEANRLPTSVTSSTEDPAGRGPLDRFPSLRRLPFVPVQSAGACPYGRHYFGYTARQDYPVDMETKPNLERHEAGIVSYCAKKSGTNIFTSLLSSALPMLQGFVPLAFDELPCEGGFHGEA